MQIQHSSLHGALRVMPSKSASHRAVLMAALCHGESVLSPLQLSNDVQATLDCMKALGLAQAQTQPLPGGDGFVRCRVNGGLQPVASKRERVADCGESGSTLRFLMPLALDGCGPVRLVGHGRLMERPLDVYRELFAAQGVAWRDEPGAIVLDGRLHGGDFSLRGDVSSQFITGLLLALPRLETDSRIHITTQLESRAYVELTRDMQARFGIQSAWEDAHTLFIPGNQRVKTPGEVEVEGDWSHAAFYLVAGLIGGGVTLTGLDAHSVQGDRAIVDVLRAMGGEISWQDGAITAQPSKLHGTQIDASQIPDLVPILAVAACAAQGVTRITGAARLRIKESDRLSAIAGALNACGARVTELPDGLVIQGGQPLHGASVEGCNDHRIVMAMAVAAALCDGEITISDAEAVAKSAPAFWQEYASLGGQAR